MNTLPPHSNMGQDTSVPVKPQRRKEKKADSWPRRVTFGREVVRVYRRRTPSGNLAYMVANYSTPGKRRFDSYATEKEALDEALALAKRLAKNDAVAARLTDAQAIAFVSATNLLQPLGVDLVSAVTKLVEAANKVGFGAVTDAAEFYAKRHRPVTPKSVSAVMDELISVKEVRIKKGKKGSDRYLQDLKSRLGRFAKDFQRAAQDIGSDEIQAWLDNLKLSPQSYRNYRTVLFTLFQFAVNRGYAIENPIMAVEKVDASEGEILIYTPTEIARLLAAASPEFLPSLAIGAFAGLRSAEIERLEWSDIDFTDKLITVGKAKAKTASRRIVPIHDNLAAWLEDYRDHNGKIWPGTSDEFYQAQKATAAATKVSANPGGGIQSQKPVEWKANALRHSYASYRVAELGGDSGRVAGEMGNKKAVLDRHYRELVKPADAAKWFSVRPESAPNIIQLSSNEKATA